jgi:hypothetical protein
MTWSKFHTEGPQMLGATGWPGVPGFVHFFVTPVFIIAFPDQRTVLSHRWRPLVYNSLFPTRGGPSCPTDEGHWSTIHFSSIPDLLLLYLHQLHSTLRSRDSSVSIVTRYGLGGPEIESRLGARFSAPVRTGPGAHPASYTMGTGSFLGVKRSRRRVDHPPPSNAEVKERVELYLYSHSGPSWPVLGEFYLYFT